ncbi:hypothetical protein MMC22_006704 [Lobaria immixta]|nr:hypothetical protein [Lobaria immixta]
MQKKRDHLVAYLPGTLLGVTDFLRLRSASGASPHGFHKLINRGRRHAITWAMLEMQDEKSGERKVAWRHAHDMSEGQTSCGKLVCASKVGGLTLVVFHLRGQRARYTDEVMKISN